MTRRHTVVVVAAIVVASSCALVVGACTGGPEVKDGRFDNGTVRYNVGVPDSGWTTMKLETANAAWHNESLRASLLVNSHCEGVADSPLEGLTNDLLMGMTDREIVKQDAVQWSKREALESTATAKLDGVPRKLQLFVLKKDGCVYDIVLDSDPAQFDVALAAYRKVRDGFDVAGRADHG